MKKKRNPQDATLRNIRALKKEVVELKRRIKQLEAVYLTADNRIHANWKGKGVRRI